jgi:hypothetical protein
MKSRLKLLGCFALLASSLSAPAAVPLSMTREGETLRLTWPVENPALRLQSTTNLTTPNWVAATNPVFVNGVFQVTEPIEGSARFYRLSNECDTNALIVPVVLLKKIGPGAPFTNQLVPNPALGTPTLSIVQDIILSNEKEYYFDASLTIHPGTCSTNNLTFRWRIEYPGIEDYQHPGITGYTSPVLHMPIATLLADDDVVFRLVVTDEANPTSETSVVQYEIRTTVTGNAIVP